MNNIEVKKGTSSDSSIVMFRATETGKYTEEDFNNSDLLNKIVEDVKSDFVIKCVAFLDTCSTMPSSLYTYDFFNKMFSIMQNGDVTSSSGKEVYSFLISHSEDIDQIVHDIYKLYTSRSPRPFMIKEFPDELHGEDLVHKMFGAGEFPFLKVKYAWHEGRREWHYVYSITR